MQALKFLALAVVVAVAAIGAPRYGPDLLSAFVNRETPATEAAPPPVAAPPPAAPREPTSQRRPVKRVPAARGGRLTLRADRRGHFLVEAWINGRPVPAMVDTGASIVTLNAESARKIGIRPPRSAFRTPISTVNGTIAAARVTLREVRVGGIRMRNVDAVVVPEGLMRVNLLGMNYLGRLSKFEISGPRLVLVP